MKKIPNLDIALKLKSKLEGAGIRVLMSRTTDISKSLQERVNEANSKKADLFISIHNNSVLEKNPVPNGTETYFSLNGAKYSAQLTYAIHRNVVRRVGLRDRGVKTADFYVIKNTNMTAALVEVAFLSNPYEESLLRSDSFKEKAAQGIFEGIREFLNAGVINNTHLITIDSPRENQLLSGMGIIGGWSIDSTSSSGTGIDAVHIYLNGPAGSGKLLGGATYGVRRADVADVYGKNFLNSGFNLSVNFDNLPKGINTLYIYSRNPSKGWNYVTQKINCKGLEPSYAISIDSPPLSFSPTDSIKIGGWAIDKNSTTGTGIDAVHIYLDGPAGSGKLLGGATYGVRRPDVGAAFGERFTNSGYEFTWNTKGLTGPHTLYIYARSPVYGWTLSTKKVNINAPSPDVAIAIDSPPTSFSPRDSIIIGGWAIDKNSTSGTGIDTVHIYLDGQAGSGKLLGAATYGLKRGDVATAFGERFTNSGYNFTWNTKGLSGTHTLYVYARSPVHGWTLATKKVNIGEDTTNVVTPETSIVGKVNVTNDMLINMFMRFNSDQSQIDRARRIAPYYIKYADLFNIRVDIAWAQMCHETGFLKYGGIVPPDANNFCGLGATSPGVYNTFATEELGVIAHFAHLAWYVYPDHLDIRDSKGDLYCSTKYDPRHFGTGHNYIGDKLYHLNERWSVPGTTYADSIARLANEIYK